MKFYWVVGPFYAFGSSFLVMKYGWDGFALAYLIGALAALVPYLLSLDKSPNPPGWSYFLSAPIVFFGFGLVVWVPLIIIYSIFTGHWIGSFGDDGDFYRGR
jgi:hypothetical protein